MHASELEAISKRPEALSLVLPAIMAILREVAINLDSDSDTAGTVLEARHLVALTLLNAKESFEATL